MTPRRYPEQKFAGTPTQSLEILFAKLVKDAIETSDHWILGSQERISPDRLFGMVQMDRIADAMLPLGVFATYGKRQR